MWGQADDAQDAAVRELEGLDDFARRAEVALSRHACETLTVNFHVCMPDVP